MYNLVSFAGIFILMAFTWLLSADAAVAGTFFKGGLILIGQ